MNDSVEEIRKVINLTPVPEAKEVKGAVTYGSRHV